MDAHVLIASARGLDTNVDLGCLKGWIQMLSWIMNFLIWILMDTNIMMDHEFDAGWIVPSIYGPIWILMLWWTMNLIQVGFDCLSNLKHLNQTLTFVPILNMNIKIGSSIKSNLYLIHESILNIRIHDYIVAHLNQTLPFVSRLDQQSFLNILIHDYNFCLFKSNPNICIQIGSPIKSNQYPIYESILNIPMYPRL